MTERVVVTIHLPLEMGAVARILKAIAREFPDAVIDEAFQVRADDDPRLTMTDRRRRMRERSRG